MQQIYAGWAGIVSYSEGLKNIVDILNHKERQELLKIDQKYSKLMRPYLDKRNEIIKRVPKFW